MGTRTRGRTKRSRAAASKKTTCAHCCFHLLDGYLHGQDVPAGCVKEECCRCYATRVIPREQCEEIRQREPKPFAFESKAWVLREEDRCYRIVKRMSTGRMAAA
jgi:hypothetical protein